MTFLGKHAEMCQHTSYATATKREVLRPDRAASAQLGANSRHAHRAGSRGRGTRIAVIADNHGERRTKCLCGCEIAPMQLGVDRRLDDGAGQEVERSAP